MGKVFALLVILLAAGVGYGGYLTHNNIALYNEIKPQLLNSLNESLGEGLQLSCQSENSLLGAIQKDTCNIYADGNRLATLWHQATIEPFRASGEFGLDGQSGMIALATMLAPSVIEGQKGEWSFNPVNQLLNFRYQTGASDSEVAPDVALKIEPLVVAGHVTATGNHEAFTSISLAQFSVTEKGSDRRVALKNFYTDVKGAQHRGVFISERSDLKIDSFQVEFDDNNLRINNIAAKTAGSSSGKFLSSLSTLEFNTLAAAYGPHNLHMDKTQLSVFADKIDLDALAKLQEENPLPGLLTLLTQGFSLYLDNASTSFTYQDSRSGMLGTAGDLRLTGNVMFPVLADIPDDPLSLLDEMKVGLTINASPSLSYGPQADLVMEFIAVGWIDNSSNRLISKLELKNGIATINGLPVDALQLIPQYEEDH